MTVYAGNRRALNCEAGEMGQHLVEILDCGDGRMPCFECHGTGDWPYGPTPAECGPCVDCKGTGKIMVSI